MAGHLREPEQFEVFDRHERRDRLTVSLKDDSVPLERDAVQCLRERISNACGGNLGHPYILYKMYAIRVQLRQAGHCAAGGAAVLLAEHEKEIVTVFGRGIRQERLRGSAPIVRITKMYSHAQTRLILRNGVLNHSVVYV